MSNSQYVYVYLDPTKPGRWCTSLVSFLFQPIYVGQGANNRWFNHLYEKSNSLKANKIKKLISSGFTRTQLKKFIIKVSSNLTRQEAFDVEDSLIMELGTICHIDTVPTGPLTNMVRECSARRAVSEETKAKLRLKSNPAGISAAWKKNYLERCTNISAAYNYSPEASANRSAGQRGREVTEYQRRRASETFAGVQKSTEQRAKMSLASAGKLKSDKHRTAISMSKRDVWVIEFNGFQETVYDFKAWCKLHAINGSSFKSAYRRQKPFGGFILTKVQ